LESESGKYYIINQEGNKIPPAAIKIHGIDDETAARSHWTHKEVLLWFIDSAEKADQIIGHNIYFDTSCIKANVIREFGVNSDLFKTALAALDKSKRIDVMRETASYNGGWLTLSKMYNKLFGEDYKGHHAQADIEATERCFKEYIRLGVLDYETGKAIKVLT
jgi:hypothetical protein